MKTTFAIIGGGIAGLTTAIAFKKMGIEAPVFEAAPVFKPVGAGLVLAANAMRAYRQLGLYDELTGAGHRIEQFTIYDRQGKVINRTRTDGLKNGMANLAIHRAELHRVLLEQVDQDLILTGKRSEDMDITDRGYHVCFDDGSELEAKYLIVAEGIHSAIRRKVLPDAVERYSGYTCWRGIADNASLNVRETSETWGAAGRFGIVPLGNNKVYWFATKNAAPVNARMQTMGAAGLLENFRDYHTPITSIISATPDGQILWNDIVDLKPIHRYAFENLVLIGDAAHATTPNMGQGACQAVEDALILAGCLGKHSVVGEAFADFQRRRLKRTHYIVNQSWNMGKIAQWENNFMVSLRNAAFRALPAWYYRKQLEKIYAVDLYQSTH